MLCNLCHIYWSGDSVWYQVHAAKQTFSSFDDMIEKSDLPVLVDFYAIWYTPAHHNPPLQLSKNKETLNCVGWKV
jgi:hypothetical protein